MRLTLFLIILSSLSVFAQELAPAPTVEIPAPPKPYRPVMMSHCRCGREAHYLGGAKALSTFINKHISFPAGMDWGNTNRVKAYVMFVVEKNGNLTDVRVIHTNFPEANEYIVEVFRNMTDWVGSEFGCGANRTNVRVPISLEIR